MYHCLRDLSLFYFHLHSLITEMDQQFQIMIPSFKQLTQPPFIATFSFSFFSFLLFHFHPHLDFPLYPILSFQNMPQTHSIYQITTQYNKIDNLPAQYNHIITRRFPWNDQREHHHYLYQLDDIHQDTNLYKILILQPFHLATLSLQIACTWMLFLYH